MALAEEPNGPLGAIPGGPYGRAFAITPHDTNEIAFITSALMAYTTAGLINIVTAGGDAVSIYLPLGVLVKVRARIVKSTSAVAAGITGFY